MTRPRRSTAIGRFIADYGMLIALLLLCAFFSWRTMATQHPQGATAGRLVAQRIATTLGSNANIVVVVRKGDEDVEFADAVVNTLKSKGIVPLAVVQGMPVDARKAIQKAL